MGYQVITPADLPAEPDRPCVRLSVSDAAGVESVAVNVYEADPGEQLPLEYHYHDEQEEVFYVLSGPLAVETPERTFEVRTDELFVVDPRSSHRAYNPDTAESSVRVLAIGAPRVDDAHPYDPNG